MNNIKKVFLLTVGLTLGLYSQAQDKILNPDISYAGTPRSCTIGGINISGVEGYEDYMLTGISGLQVGQEIEIPGAEITNAVKRYWRHGLFSDVQISADSIVGRKIYLHIALKTRPRVSTINYEGLKKSEREDMEQKLGLLKGSQITPNMIDRAKILAKKYFDDKGFKNAEIVINQHDDVANKNEVILDVIVDKKQKMKVRTITIDGNKAMSTEEELELLKKRSERERKARIQAETILEQKALELFESNQNLLKLNQSLEIQINEKISELSLSERRYRQLVGSVQDIIYKVSPDGYFTFVNSVVEQRLGYTEEEIVGKHFTELVVPEYHEELIGFYLNMITNGKESTYNEFPVYTKNHQLVWIGQTVRLVDEGNNVLELVAVARDITDRKNTEEQLKNTQIRLSTLIYNMQSGILVEDENRKIILINQFLCDIFGIQGNPEEMIGVDCAVSMDSLKHQFQDPGEFVSQVNNLLSERKMFLNETVYMADKRILERSYIPIFLDNQYMGHLWQYNDVTEKYHAQEAIRKSEEKYRGIMNNMELGLLEVDNEQTIVRAYARFCEMVGYSAEELVGKNAQELFLPEEFVQLIEEQQSLRKVGGSSSYELPILHKNGDIIWTLISGAPIIGEDGVVTGSIFFLSVISLATSPHLS